MADVVLLDIIISLEMIKEIVEVRKVRLVRANVFCNVRSREWAALERTSKGAVVRRVVHVGQRYEDLEVLGQALDGVDLDGACQSGDVLFNVFGMLHHRHLQYRQTPQTLQYSHQTA